MIDLDDIDEDFDIPENSIPIEQSNEGTISNINTDEYNSSESDDDDSTFEFEYDSESESNNMRARENLSDTDSEPRLPKRAKTA